MAGQNYSRNIRQALLYDYIKKPQHYDDSSPPEDMWRGRLAGEMLLHSRSERMRRENSLSLLILPRPAPDPASHNKLSHRLLCSARSAADWSDEMRELDAVPGGGAARL
jgi:hypothetical protein